MYGMYYLVYYDYALQLLRFSVTVKAVTVCDCRTCVKSWNSIFLNFAMSLFRNESVMNTIVCVLIVSPGPSGPVKMISY